MDGTQKSPNSITELVLAEKWGMRVYTFHVHVSPLFILFATIAAGVWNLLSTPEGTYAHIPPSFIGVFVFKKGSKVKRGGGGQGVRTPPWNCQIINF